MESTMLLTKSVISSFFVAVFTFSFIHGESVKQPLFSIISPKIIYPNTIYNVIVYTEKGESNVIVRLKLSCGSADYSAEENEIPGGKTQVIGMDINELPAASCSLKVAIKSKDSGDDTIKDFYNTTKTLHVASKSISILIQLDKPIYKPGETVKYLIVFLNRQLRPIAGEGAEIKITDPQSNVIRLHKNESIPKGLFSGEMKLSSEPNLGDWEISARFQEAEEKLIFSVDQYVLPKFKVEVKLPSFILNGTSTIKAEIIAKYTYGKGVKGQVSVQLKTPQDDFYYPYYDDFIVDRRKRAAIIRPPPFWRRRTTTRAPVKLTTLPIDGSVFVDLDIPPSFQTMSYTYEKEFTVEATVTENITGKQLNGTGKVKMYVDPYKIEMIDTPKYYKPGFQIKFTFKITSQDGTPISDDKPDALIISHGFSYEAKDSTFKSSIPATGLVIFSVMTPSNENLRIDPMKVTYKNVKATFYIPEKMQSSSQTYIQVTIDDNDKRIVGVKATNPMKALNYLVVNQGKIVDSGRENFEEEKLEVSFNINPNIEKNSGVEVTVIVFAIFGADNEIVVDSTSYKIKMNLSNYFSIKLSKEKVEPGDNITLSLETNSNSLVALRGVDQSVLLLREEKNIDAKRMDEVMKGFSDENSLFNSWGGSPAFRTFDDAKVLVITNCLYVEQEIYRYEMMAMPGILPMMARGEAMMMDDAIVMATQSSIAGAPALAPPPPQINSFREKSFVAPGRVREKFPESWIWETLEVLNTKLDISKTVPDTLTSWVLTGFSLNSELGIGVSLTPQILETFRPFFISLNLPYSVIKGEVFALQVLLHNYLNEEVTGIVTFKNNKKQFKFAGDKDGDEIKTSIEKSVKIPPLQVSSLTFVVIPVRIGEIKVELDARTTMAGDAISQSLTVKPPGHKQSKNAAVLLDVRSGTPVKLNLTAVFPEKRVSDGDSVKFSVIGDLLGSTIANLDKLIQMPCGCGEQNMLNFVPDIVILDYLKSSGLITPGIKRTALNFLEIGYQRELTYRHFDGSFSAFGQSDSSGSTWLTAFVVRSFISAKRYITVDETIITSALEFLANLQNENGMFIEKGQVIHSDMHGGANSGIALSAYVLLSFLEASEMMSISFKYNTVVKKCLEYLSKKMVDLEDPYPTILISYAFHVANFNQKEESFKKVEKLVRRDSQSQHTYWGNTIGRKIEPDAPVMKPMIFPPPPPPIVEQKPVSVEMTAYALQIYLLRNKVVESVPIAKWLLAQRNANGGFLSTQDTVVGLTALAKFAMLTKSADSKLTVALNHLNGVQNFNVNKDNAIVLQEFILPSNTKTVTVEASGIGTAMAQLSWNYYVDDNALKPAFSITTQVKKSEESQGKFSLRICSAFTQGNESNMVVMEVNLPSGFVFESENLSNLRKVKKLMRYEEENEHTKLNIYFTSLTSTKVCVDLDAVRLFNVAKLAPANIFVYDYYDTTRKARAFYEPPSFSVCDMCSLDHNMCGDKVNCVI